MQLRFTTEHPAFHERALLKDLAARRRAETQRLRLRNKLARLASKPARSTYASSDEVVSNSALAADPVGAL